tara:strand:+ start:1147 stop:2769 length:1623 start_codon:yes stop_codon:yes gene_type:complete
MPEEFTRIASERSPYNMSTSPEWDRTNLLRPEGIPSFQIPPLQSSRPPRCPPFVEITNSDQLLPYLEHVAQRPYNHGLNACWDLKPGERVMLRVDNWHSELTIEACKKIFKKYQIQYDIKYIDRGPIPQWVGADEVEYYLFRTKELAEWMDMWEEEEKNQAYDKILMGYGGPVLAERLIKIQRMPFITPEILASPAHAMPIEVLNAMDMWTWERVRAAKRSRITDPEGTDLSFTNHDEYWDSERKFYDPTLTAATWTGNEHFGKTYLPGHVTGRPWMFHPTKEDGEGVIAGTTNHIAAVDWTQLIIERSKITQINEGGEFGDKLRDVMERTKHIQYPTFPDKGIMHWWEASIGTNPHIHRPRKDFPSGFVNCLYERVRSGVIHMGFGTIISSMAEREAARMGHLVGHWHLHLYFPTYEAEMAGDNETIIKNGRLGALDDPAIRKIAAKYGDPDMWLDESWNPAVPGINMDGNYWDHYARDPMHWVKSELEICRNYHPMFMKMVGADDKYCHGAGADWWKGGCCNHSGVEAPILGGNCCGD